MTVRRNTLLLALIPLGLLAAAAPVPTLKLFGSGFEAGQWKMTPMDADGQARDPNGAAQCFASPDAFIHAGNSSAGGADCGYTVVEDGADRATVTYSCKGKGNGRTTIRREGNSYLVFAQGIDGREPYEMRGRYERTGGC